MSDGKTNLELGFELILKTFQKYANSGNDGSADKLEKNELKLLFQNEFKGYLALSDKTCEDDLFKKFDDDDSNSVDFVEFLKIVAQVADDADILNKIAGIVYSEPE